MESESCQSEISSDPNRGIVKYLAKCLIELVTHSESVLYKIKKKDVHTEISSDESKTIGIDIIEHNLKIECIQEGPILKVIASLKNCIVELLTLCSQHNIKINYDITRPNIILYDAFDEPQRILVMNNLTLYAISIVEQIINSKNLFKSARYIDNALHIKSSFCNIYKEIKYIPKRPDIINNMDGSFQELTSKNEFTDAYNYLNEKLFILCKYINKFIRAYQKHCVFNEQTTSDENTDKSSDTNCSNEKKRKHKETEQVFIKTENDQVFKIPKILSTKKNKNGINENETINNIESNQTIESSPSKKKHKQQDHDKEFHNNDTVIETNNIREKNKINTSIENKTDSPRENKKKKLENKNHNNDTKIETDNNEIFNISNKNEIDTTDTPKKTKKKRKNSEVEYDNKNKTVETDNVESEILNERNLNKMDTSIKNKTKNKKRKSETKNHLNDKDESINLDDSHKEINVSKSDVSKEETVIKDNEQYDIVAPYQPELFPDILHAIETGQIKADLIKEYNDFTEFIAENSMSEDDSIFVNSGGEFSDYKQIISENSLSDDEKFLHIQNLLEIEHDKSILSDEDIDKLTNLNIFIDFEIPPAHLIGAKLTAGPTHIEKEQLKDLGVTSGHFTKDESNIIRKNWKLFCEKHGFENNPSLFTNLYHNNKSYISYMERRKFVQFLGQGLPHKALHSIFRHFKVLFQKSIKLGRFSPEEDQLILTYMNKIKREDNKKFARLAPILNRNRVQIETRYRTLKKLENNPRVKWTLELKSEFLNHLLKESDAKTIDDLKEEISDETYLIISKLMNIPPVKLKGHWLIHLYTQLFAKRPLYKDEIKKELILKLDKMKVNEIICIKWNKILPDFKGFTKYYLLFLLQNTIHYQVPRKLRKDFRGSIVYLRDNYVPKLKSNTNKDKRLELTKDGKLKHYE